MNNVKEVRHDTAGCENCPEHSKVELFMQMSEKTQDAQWKAIDGIRKAAWTMAVSMLGTLLTLLVTLILKHIHVI